MSHVRSTSQSPPARGTQLPRCFSGCPPPPPRRRKTSYQAGRALRQRPWSGSVLLLLLLCVCVLGKEDIKTSDRKGIREGNKGREGGGRVNHAYDSRLLPAQFACLIRPQISDRAP
jgi:hypothetical protein